MNNHLLLKVKKIICLAIKIIQCFLFGYSNRLKLSFGRILVKLYYYLFTGFSGRTFRPVVCHSTSGTLISILAIFFTTVLYMASKEHTD